MGNFFLRTLATCLALALICALPAGAENRALLVGVGEYQQGYANLPGIEKDIEAMRKVTRMVGFRDSQVKVLMNKDATLQNIQDAFENWLIQGVGQTDRVLFYFSGHGSQVYDHSGDEADRADEVLVTHDMKVTDGKLANSFLDDDLNRLLAKVRAKETLVFIDACHSGTASKSIDFTNSYVPKTFYYKGMPMTIAEKGNFSVQTVEKEQAGSQYVALSAARDDQAALATSMGSLFTLAVLTSVEKAHREDRNLTLATLQQEATKFIHINIPNPESRHDPQITGKKELAQNVEIIQPPASEATLWDRLEYLADKASHVIPIRTNQKRFRRGDRLEIICDVKRGGYLNILELAPEDVKATVLFPNRFHPNNYVPEGKRVTIPSMDDDFTLTATKQGKSLIVVFQTEEKINAYTDGQGHYGALFKTMSQASRSNFEVSAKETAREGTYFGAGKFITVVE